jgi:hypothetical protein
MLSSREYRLPMERLIFAMTANRCLAPGSKLAMEHWVKDEVLIDGLPEIEVHQLYRAMDFLLESSEEIQKQVFFSVANIFNLEVDLLFLDTTTTYFEIEGTDENDDADENLRQYGYSKDERANHAQVVIAFAVTRNGIPVRCWVWPGNTADKAIIDSVKKDLNVWNLGRVVMVADAGFNSAKNKRILQGAGGHYILSEKLRNGSKLAEALSRKGKYKELENGLLVKEVIVGDGEARQRYVVVKNPRKKKNSALPGIPSSKKQNADWQSLTNWTANLTRKQYVLFVLMAHLDGTSARHPQENFVLTKQRSKRTPCSTANFY